jgi:hypothetical protein
MAERFRLFRTASADSPIPFSGQLPRHRHQDLVALPDRLKVLAREFSLRRQAGSSTVVKTTQ